MGQAGLVIGLAISFLLVGNVVLERGVVGMLWGIPTSAVFVANYDDPEKYVRWDAFKSEYKFLGPSTLAISEVFVSIALLNVVEKQLLYGNKVAILEPTVWSKANSPFYRILLPWVLILVLDAQDNIRGKLLSPIQMTENTTQVSPQFWSMELSSSQFWFHFPSDMRGTTYTVIVELFGYWVFTCCGEVYSLSGVEFIKDAYYGMLPRNHLQGGTAQALLAFSRQSFNAPAPELTLQSALSYASIASTFMGAIFGVLIDRRKRIYDFLQNNASAILLFWISVILFVVMVILIVTLK